MFGNNPREFERLGEVKKQYTIIRSISKGKKVEIYKGYEVNKPEVYYVIKSYIIRDAFERELQILSELTNAKNIMQMINHYPLQAVIVCECALYCLETFLGHQEYIQRHEEESDIIKDIVSGLSELQKHKIVHTDLSPKNIMYFQEKDGERWKLIDFDAACFVGSSNHVNLITNYSAPEVIKAYDEKIEIIANFAMDMFSFGLILYLFETGHHYWDGKEDKEEFTLPLGNIRDSDACFAIKQLLNKDISLRMTLEEFMQTPYYSGESDSRSNPTPPKRCKRNSLNRTRPNSSIILLEGTLNYDKYRCGMSEADFLLYQAQLTQGTFQIFLEKYHNEMKQSLKIMNDKIDNCTRAVEDLSELTKKIPQWLVKLKNEKVPRVFVMIPDRKDWKRPATWFISKPFRLLFVCEHKKQWHIPEQKGCKVLEIPQFIKKYGPWINLCLRTLSYVLSVMTSNIFPHGVSDILSSIFNISDHFELMQHFQEIIDTVDIGVKTMFDDDPEFAPLSNEAHIPHKMINASGLRGLKKFLDTQESSDNFGGLVQCVDENTQEVLWLCQEHRNGYCVRSIEQPEMAPASPNSSVSQRIQVPSTKSRRSKSPGSLKLPSSKLLSNPQSSQKSPILSQSKQHPTILQFHSKSSMSTSTPETSPTETIFVPPEGFVPSKVDYNKYDLNNSLDPYLELEHLNKLLYEVIENSVASGRKHFRNDEVMQIAEKLREHKNNFKHLCQLWHDIVQKGRFIKIINNQVALYIHFLRSIVRYCVVKDFNSVTMQMSFLAIDTYEIHQILKAGKSFNKHLGKLSVALEASHNLVESNAIQTELDHFFSEPKLEVSIDDSNIIHIIHYKDLSQWYYTVDRACVDNLLSPSKEETTQGTLFNSTTRLLDNCIIVTGRLLKYLDNIENLLCVEKEIYLYNGHQLNEHEFIMKFCGYSIQNCKPTLFYENTDYGDLFTYFQVNHNSSENLVKDWKGKVKLAWEISQAIKFLHENNKLAYFNQLRILQQRILHLDLRSANILLKYDATNNSLIPKISNFLWSKKLSVSKTFVHPKIPIPSKDKIWKRWHDPERLINGGNFESLLPSSDIYSLGLLFWEIAWCKEDNLPFKKVAIKKLYKHLQTKEEKLPEIPKEYRQWELLIINMWQRKPVVRNDIMTVELIMRKLSKGRADSMHQQPIPTSPPPQYYLPPYTETIS
ncbi:5761_t:CDS:10 [Funneliformis geosporum]|nr:5761_t:CDS:10 [Funneliformis geosporum]